jgi:hypothetical protein
MAQQSFFPQVGQPIYTGFLEKTGEQLFIHDAIAPMKDFVVVRTLIYYCILRKS